MTSPRPRTPKARPHTPAPMTHPPAHEAECTALRQRVAELEAELNRRDVTALVDQAVKAGHLLPTLREWSISLGTKDTEALKGFLAGCARAMAGDDDEAREA